MTPPASADTLVLLRLDGISKRFGDLLANDGIDLEVRAGEVVALLGENGAGKTTLMSILFGHYVADAGRVLVAGAGGELTELPRGSPQAALAAGIGMVHQHFALAHNLTGLENIMLGTAPLLGLGLRRQEARRRVAALIGETGLQVDLDTPVHALSVGERQRVEILKALYRKARLLVLDEPTAVLTPADTEGLFATIRALATRGLGIIFIGHKLAEVLALAHRIVVLRGGRKVAELPAADADRGMLARHMIGRELASPLGPSPVIADAEPQARLSATSADAVAAASRDPGSQRRPPAARVASTGMTGAAVLQLERVGCGSGRDRLDDVDLTVHGGEIVGIAGVSGNGQRALAGLVSGQVAIRSGRVCILGAPAAGGPRAMLARGVGRIAEDRHQDGIVPGLSVAENLILERTRSADVQAHGRLRHAAIRAQAESAIRAFDVRCPGPEAPIRLLSGGNIQKLLLARALHGAPRLILANQPTRGLDIGATEAVRGRLQRAAAEGAGVLLISEDLDELMALAHRIAVLHAGRLTPAVATARLDIATVGLAMAGHPAGALAGREALDA